MAADAKSSELGRPGAVAQTQHDVDLGFSRWQQDMANVAHHVLTIGAALLFIVPLVWMISTSFRDPTLAPPTQLEWLPSSLVFDNYTRVATELMPFSLYLT